MTAIIQWMLENFSLLMLILAMICILILRILNSQLPFSEIAFRGLTLFALGVTAIYAFAMHAFFPELSAQQIGWQNNPFQYEVAMANLGFGVIALIAFNASYGFRLATVIANTCWLWGDASGHIYQMAVNHNFTNGNAGSWFWTDVLVPALLWICLLQLPQRRSRVFH